MLFRTWTFFLLSTAFQYGGYSPATILESNAEKGLERRFFDLVKELEFWETMMSYPQRILVLVVT